MKKRPAFSAEEHELIRRIKALKFGNGHLLLAVSGGRDSMLLLHVMYRLQRVLAFELSVAHIHHGQAGSHSQKQFRDKAEKQVRRTCDELKVPCCVLTYKGKVPLHSEDDFRKFREQSYKRALSRLQKKQERAVLLVTAHHNADLVETQILRLVRGTGSQGLPAMAFMQKNRLRPFIDWTEEQVQKLSEYLQIKFVVDPSNRSDKHLRNWLRHKWLPQLEKKISGGVRSLGRSLQLIAELGQARDWSNCFTTDTIRMPIFLSLSPVEKQQVLAIYMHKVGMQGYSQNHIREILKRLDNSRSELSFTLLKHEWSVNAEHMSARPS